ncbi:carbohydrate porin [Burkholderia gladioli]|uniref:carbohydrate porin n=1 Tax=Burkholderia gladioli TaxID=28095 RepID=UPI0016403684|nr:carbohydrate porin [Burkholderia gladioli]
MKAIAASRAVRTSRAATACGLVALACSAPAFADDASVTSADEAGLLARPHLFGNWGGARSALASRGIDFHLSLTDELAYNLAGGDHRTGRAATQLAAGMTADLDRLWGIRHTTFAFTMTDRFGRSLDADAHLGTSQQTQEIYGRGQTVWLTKLTLERTFLDGRLAIEAGRDSEGSDFDAADCHFQNLSLCGPQGPNLYGNYWMSYPGSVWMTRATLKTSAATYVKFGVYQQNPRYYDASWEHHNAWKPISPGGNTGVVLPLEFGWLPSAPGREGSYRIGAMLNTGGMPDLLEDAAGRSRAATGAPGRQSSTSYNVWLAINQRVSGTNGGEGLRVGLRAVTGDRATSVLDRQITLSFEYDRPFHRVGDRFGLGFAATHTSSREAEYQLAYNTLHPDDASAVGHGYEYTAEMFYSWQALPSVALQPNLQVVLHPGGTNANRNVFVGGLRTTVTF